MHKIVVFVPASDVEQVKDALFNAGAGRFGNYDRCAWQTLGTGQFRPNAEANPFLGETDQVHHEPEYRVELICDDSCVRAALRAVVAAHPYEEPAYEAFRIVTLRDLPEGE